LPVEDFTDIDLGTDEKTFDELDRAAAKAIKTLEKRNKEIKKAEESLKKKGGAFTSEEEKIAKRKQKQTFEAFQPDVEPGEIPLRGGSPGAPVKRKNSLNEIIDQRFNDNFDKKINDGVISALSDEFGGFDKLSNVVGFAKNPINAVTGLLRAIPFIGGVIAFADFAKIIIEQVAKIDAFFKAFVDRIDDRVNQLRPKEQQASIRAGDIQIITTTAAGGTDPRESYNTFNEFNNNQAKLESDFAVRDTSGI